MAVKPQIPGEPGKESLLLTNTVPENPDVSKSRFYVISRMPQQPRYTETCEYAALGQAVIYICALRRHTTRTTDATLWME